MNEDNRRLTTELESTFVSENMARSSCLRTCKIVCYLARLIVVRFWKITTSACLILLLLYWFYGGALTLLFLMMSVFGIFYYAQDMFLYYPSQPPNARLFVEQPEKFHLPCENVFAKTSDGCSLNMYLIKQQQSTSCPTIMLLHGNAGNIGHRLMIAYYLYNMCHSNVLLVEWRGYGKSSGSPSESGLYIDAETGLKWLKARGDLDPNKLYVYGASLGGAISIHLAADPRFSGSIAGLILENTFTSLPDVAKSIFNVGVLDFLPLFCYKNQYMSEYRIGKVTMPTLFLSGQNDELIPPNMMSSLYNLSGSKKKLLVPFEGGTHNETFTCPGYFESIAQFVHGVTEGTVPDTDDSTIQMDTDTSTI